MYEPNPEYFKVLKRLTVPHVTLSFGLADLDDLHAEQLYLGAAVLQHLLGCRQQLTVLQRSKRSEEQSVNGPEGGG